MLSHTQEDAEFLLARIFALRDEAQALSDALESEHLSRGAHDHLRDLHKEATRQLIPPGTAYASLRGGVTT